MSNYTVKVTIDGDDNLTPVLKKTNQEIDKMQKNVQETNQSTTSASSGMNTFKSAVGALGAALAGVQIMDKIGELNQLGTEVQGTSILFETLAGGADAASQSLEKMRQATFGVVSDFDLMSGASSLLNMGLAGSNAEAEQLIELAYKLKKPTETASEAIENFSLMLANQSVARLDSFGISSGQVRSRIEELIEAGQALNREDAFKMAVLEIGTEKITRLGDTIEQVNNTSLNRLAAQFQNLTAGVGVFVATGVEAGAQLTELTLMALDPSIGEEAGVSFGEAFINAVISEITGAEIPALEIEVNEDREKGKEIAEAYISEIEKAVAETAPMSSIGGTTTTGAMINTSSITGQRWNPARDFTQAIASAYQLEQGIKFWNDSITDTIATVNNLVSPVYNRVQSGVQAYSYQQGGQSYFDSMMSDFFSSSQRTGNAMASVAKKGFLHDYNIMGYIQNDAINYRKLPNGQEFLSESDANALVKQFKLIQESYAELESLNARGIISDEELAKATRMRDSFADVATEAQNIALAIDSINLDTLLGIDSPDSQLMQLGSTIASGIEDADIRQAYEEALGFQSGSINELSQAIDPNGIINQTLSQIALQSPDDAVMATLQAQKALQATVELDADERVVEVLRAIGQVATSGGATITVNVQAGDTPLGISSNYGLTLDEIYGSDSGIYRNGYLQQGSYEVMTGGGMGLTPFENSPYAYGENAQRFRENIGGLLEGLPQIDINDVLDFSNLELPDMTELGDNLQSSVDDVMVTLANAVFDTTLKVNVELAGVGAALLQQAGVIGANTLRQNAGRPAPTPTTSPRGATMAM